MDVALNKIMTMVKEEIEAFRTTPEASTVVYDLVECDKWTTAGVPSMREKEPITRTLHGGRLAATFAMAAMGELQRDSEVQYTAVSEEAALSDALDAAVLELVKDVTRSEMDCQVCYGLFLDPFTTPCGHTFCRKCVHRVLDHSDLCPVCRRSMALPPNITAQQGPSNVTITKLLQSLCPEAVAAREEAVRQDESETEMDTPLFICTLAFPSVPTFLHIFEPRYRLMIKRAVENGSRSFGMLLHNPSRTVQGSHGAVPFYQYGTLLHIVNLHMLPDGRSLIETHGLSRFRVVRHGSLDGYMVGKIERVDDMPLHSEEAREAAETTLTTRHFSAQDYFAPSPHHRPADPRPTLTAADINSLPTQALMDLGTTFVGMMKSQSAPWLNRRVFQIYGDCPTDPALFPWWFASVLPIADGPKYRLLETSSVRERLKMCVTWISHLEAQRWYDSLFCQPCF